MYKTTAHDTQYDTPINLWYKSPLREWNCWSLIWSWSIACQRCSNYFFILGCITDLNGLGKGSDKTRRETFKLHLSLRIWCVSYWMVDGMLSAVIPDAEKWSSAATSESCVILFHMRRAPWMQWMTWSLLLQRLYNHHRAEPIYE